MIKKSRCKASDIDPNYFGEDVSDFYENDDMKILHAAHVDEIRRQKAEEWPRGGSYGPTQWESYTSKGYLISRFDKKKREIEHTWDTTDFEKRAQGRRH